MKRKLTKYVVLLLALTLMWTSLPINLMTTKAIELKENVALEESVSDADISSDILEEDCQEELCSEELSSYESSGLYRIPYNDALITAVGKQGSLQCMAYALAYCRTILDGYTHAGTEYWKSGVGGMYGAAGYQVSGATTKQSLLKIVYDQINAGYPVCMYVTGYYRSNTYWYAPGDHWVTVVGYKTSANPNSLTESDFYILDPGTCSYDYLTDGCTRYTSNALRISSKGAGSVSPYAEVYVNEIGDTNAKINATLTNEEYLTSAGFYISKNFDMSSAAKVQETANISVKYMWYDMNKWYGVLEPGTTYYYQFYIVKNGAEIRSDIQNFTTTGDSIAPTILSAQIINVTPDSYTVEVVASDNIGIAKVCFPTWTEYNGQDDLVGEWWINTAVTTPNSNNKYIYQVNRSAHNGEYGLYHTDAYAYDAYGNHSCFGFAYTFKELKSISLSNTTLALNIGNTYALQVSYNPSNTTDSKIITWSSSDSSVATVNANGTVTAKATGSAIITATSVNGRSASCTVTVSCVHDYTSKITPATINENGSVEDICEICGEMNATVIYMPKTVKLSKNTYTYTGKVCKPTVTVEDSNGKVVSSDSYTVKYSNNKKVGTAKVTVKFNGEYYNGTMSKTFTINECPHSYKTKIIPATTSKNGSITDTCKKCGKTKKTVIYRPKTVKLSKNSYKYTGKACKPTVTVKNSKGKVISSDSYTVKYSNNKKVGTAKVTVKFNGKSYKGKLTKTFKIKK